MIKIIGLAAKLKSCNFELAKASLHFARNFVILSHSDK